MRNRALLLALLSAIALAVSACGGDSDEDQIRSVVTEFAEAVQEKDGAKLCDSVVTGRIPGGRQCEGEVADAFFEEVEQAGEVEGVRVNEIEVEGDTATARVLVTVNGEEMDDEGTFKKVDGDWKFALDE